VFRLQTFRNYDRSRQHVDRIHSETIIVCGHVKRTFGVRTRSPFRHDFEIVTIRFPTTRMTFRTISVVNEKSAKIRRRRRQGPIKIYRFGNRQSMKIKIPQLFLCSRREGARRTVIYSSPAPSRARTFS